MSAFKRLAAWLDPEANAAREESKNVILAQQDAINEMATKLAEVGKAHDNLIGRASQAALTANARGDVLKVLLMEAAVARAYVVDHIDEIDDQLESLGPKSKKRVELETVRAAIAADLVKLNLAIDNASKVIP